MAEPLGAKPLPLTGATAVLPVQAGLELQQVPDSSAEPPELSKPTPALSLDDVKLLTENSDFKPFMARDVTSDVRNAAMKKLFTDPHYNIMDGLDIYIDDYSKPDPIPEAMLRAMTSSKFLKLFDDEDKDKDKDKDENGHEIAAARENPGTATDQTVAQLASSQTHRDTPLAAQSIPSQTQLPPHT